MRKNNERKDRRKQRRKYTSFPTHKRSEERDADVNTQQCLTMIKN